MDRSLVSGSPLERRTATLGRNPQSQLAVLEVDTLPRTAPPVIQGKRTKQDDNIYIYIYFFKTTSFNLSIERKIISCY